LAKGFPALLLLAACGGPLDVTASLDAGVERDLGRPDLAATTGRDLGARTTIDLATTREAGSPVPPDLSTPFVLFDLASTFDATSPLACCAQPGATGDSQGVGQFCNLDLDCPSGLFCETDNDAQAHFCTFGCHDGNPKLGQPPCATEQNPNRLCSNFICLPATCASGCAF
jgi:hypothetical protein